MQAQSGANIASSAQIAPNIILNSDINSAAAIDFSKLAALTAASILVGNSSNVATIAAITGDITITDAGVVAVADNKITEAMMANNAIGLDELKGGTDGELFTFDTSGNPSFVPVGTVGQVLKSGGVGVAPTFQAEGGAQTKTGSYTGDGEIDQNITGLGFAPGIVMIWTEDTAARHYVRLTGSAAGTCYFVDGPGGEDHGGVRANSVITLDADGFSVDDAAGDGDPNTNSKNYLFWAAT